MKILYKLLIILFFIWIALSIFRVILNVSKLATEEISWSSLNDEQKKEKIFKDYYSVDKFITDSTKPNSKIILLTEDGMLYYHARYSLYPRKLFWVKSNINFPKKFLNYDYIYIDKKIKLNNNIRNILKNPRVFNGKKVKGSLFDL